MTIKELSKLDWFIFYPDSYTVWVRVSRERLGTLLANTEENPGNALWKDVQVKYAKMSDEELTKVLHQRFKLSPAKFTDNYVWFYARDLDAVNLFNYDRIVMLEILEFDTYKHTIKVDYLDCLSFNHEF